MLGTLPDRVVYAKKAKLDYTEFLELIFQDEIDRRDEKGLSERLKAASLDPTLTLETFDWNAKVTFDRSRVKDLFSLGFVERSENVLLLGPVGLGKTHLAQALGHTSARARKSVLYLRATKLFKIMVQARGDNSLERTMRRLLAVDVLIIDDFALKKLDAQESNDIYEVLVERHTRASTIVTSNRDVAEWVAVFDDPILANSALDRLAHRAHQITMEGESYRKQTSPGERAKAKKA